METVSVDALLASGGGAVTITGLPAGSELAPVAGVPYQVALRAWNSRNPAGTITTVAGGTSVLLGDAGTGTVSLQVR
jgi:phosphoribosylcarboxyaminoimidazole (NCAIR) mutase